MKRIIAGLLVSLMLLSCVAPTNYLTRENWIDLDDLKTVYSSDDPKKWENDLGKPVVMESSLDTLFYFYHFKPMMYRTWEANKGLYKPTEKDNTGTWGARNEMMRLTILNGKVIAIEKNNKFSDVVIYDSQSEQAKPNAKAGIIVIIVLGVLTALLLGNSN